MRHALADAPEADQSEGHVADAPQGPGREVMPTSGMDVAVIGDDVAGKSEAECERVRRDFADSVIGRIGDPYTVPLARGGVDIVVARADAAHEPQARQRRQDPLP